MQGDLSPAGWMVSCGNSTESQVDSGAMGWHGRAVVKGGRFWPVSSFQTLSSHLVIYLGRQFTLLSMHTDTEPSTSYKILVSLIREILPL